jgi:hypothetical protein
MKSKMVHQTVLKVKRSRISARELAEKLLKVAEKHKGCQVEIYNTALWVNASRPETTEERSQRIEERQKLDKQYEAWRRKRYLALKKHFEGKRVK